MRNSFGKSATGRLVSNDNTINVRVALQGGGALGAYGAGVLIALLQNTQIRITEASGTSAGAANIFLANQIDNQRAIESIKSYWKEIGQVGEAMQIMSAFNPIGSYLYQSWAAATGTRNTRPLQYLNGLLTKSVPESQKGQIITRVNTVTKKDHSAPLTPGNFTEHIHEAHLDAVTASGALNALGSWDIDGAPHWDGVYSGKNPNLALFDQNSADPLIIVSVDNPEIAVSPSDPAIFYGMIHKEIRDFKASSATEIYHISLAAHEKVQDRHRAHPTSARVGGLLKKGYEDGLACLEKMIQDRALFTAIGMKGDADAPAVRVA